MAKKMRYWRDRSELGSPGVSGPTLILISSLTVAWEMPTPSFGDVALPSLSIRTNDSEEVRPRIIPKVRWQMCLDFSRCPRSSIDGPGDGHG